MRHLLAISEVRISSLVPARSRRHIINRIAKQLGKFTVAVLNVVVQIARLSDGRRKIVSISEIVGMEGEVVTMQEIFKFEKQGLENGMVRGTFKSTGIRPKFTERLNAAGIRLRASMFDEQLVC